MTRLLFTCFLLTSMASIAAFESELGNFADQPLLKNGPDSLEAEDGRAIDHGEFLVDPNFVFFKEITKKDSLKKNMAVVKVYFSQEPDETKEEFEAKNNYRFRMHTLWIPTFNKMIADAKKENRKLFFRAGRLALENEKHYLFFEYGQDLRGVFVASDYLISLKETIVDSSEIKKLYSRRCCLANPWTGFKVNKASFDFKYLPASWVEEFKRIMDLGENVKVKIAMRILMNQKFYREMPAETVFQVVKDI